MFTRKDLMRLMIPLIIEQILAVLVGMVDVLMVGKVGEAAVSGVSLVDSINILIIQLLAALATGGAVVAAQLLGKKDEKAACKAANQVLLSTMMASFIITIVALIGNRFLLSVIFGKIDVQVMKNAEIYFFLSAFSYPFLAIYNSCAALYRSMGNSKVSMQTSLLMNGINVIGNTFCIFVLKMGVEGVAIPTLISRMIAAFVMLYIIRNPKNIIHVDAKLRLGYQPQMLKKILRIGIPNGLENSMFQFGKIAVQSLVSTLGTATIAGFAVASNLVTLEYLPGNAIGLGLITIIGQCVGAGEIKQAKKYAKLFVGINYVILIVMIGGLTIACSPFVGFYQLSEEASKIAVNLILLHGVMMLIWPPSFVLPNALRAASDVKYTMLVSVCSMWIFRIGCSFLFVKVFDIGIMGVWLAMGIDWICRAIFFIVRFCGERWQAYYK